LSTLSFGYFKQQTNILCSFPKVKVKRQELKNKLSAGTTEARIKGVYDLLVKREDQANYCGRGKGSDGRVAVPEEIFGALCGEFFFLLSFFFLLFLFFSFFSSFSDSLPRSDFSRILHQQDEH
jgi:hypothetical protein